MECVGKSISGPRPYNEDSYLLRDLSSIAEYVGGYQLFMMVSDGVGGYESGDVASQIACRVAGQYIDQMLVNAGNWTDSFVPEHALSEIIRCANESIILERDRLGHANMGATFVGAFVSTTSAVIAHVGDSRAYKISRGKAVQLTVDHSIVGRLLANGVLDEAQAQEHPERHKIEQALGLPQIVPEFTDTFLSRREALLLCSDGISTVLDSDTLGKLTSLSAKASGVAQIITGAALRSGTDDNATVIIAFPNWRDFKLRAPKVSVFYRVTLWMKTLGARAPIIVALTTMVLVMVMLIFFSGQSPETILTEADRALLESQEASRAIQANTKVGNKTAVKAQQKQTQGDRKWVVKKEPSDAVLLMYLDPKEHVLQEYRPAYELLPSAVLYGVRKSIKGKLYLRIAGADRKRVVEHWSSIVKEKDSQYPPQTEYFVSLDYLDPANGRP